MDDSGGDSPTSDLMTPLALAVLAVPLTWACAIRKKGVKGWLQHFIMPAVVLLPLNVLEQLVRIFSLSVRLFGNMFRRGDGDHDAGHHAPAVWPLPIMALGLIFGAVQAFVFSVLTVSYLAEMVQGH